MKASALTFNAPVELVALNSKLPAVFLKDARSSERFWGFFAANIRNRNTRRALHASLTIGAR
jgi:hypothetical protein